MAMPPADMAGTTPPDVLLPEGIAIMAASARKVDGTPGIAYYDRTRGNLRYVEWNASTNAWNKPAILDGEDAMGNDIDSRTRAVTRRRSDPGGSMLHRRFFIEDLLLHSKIGVGLSTDRPKSKLCNHPPVDP